MLGCLALVRGEAVQAHEAFQESFRRYRLLNAAAELGTALGGLALTQLVLARRQAALAPLLEALGIAVNTHSHFTSVTNWVALLAYLADSGHYEQALEVYAARQALPLLANSRSEAALAAPWVAVAEEHLPPEAVQAALQRGHGRDLFAVYAELLDEFLTPPAVNMELQE
jgi:hypothetical protein